jgi:hypothetical protein
MRKTGVLIGVILLVYSLIAILNTYFDLFSPVNFLFNKVLIEILIMVGGIYIFYISVIDKTKLLAAIVGVLLFIIGLFPFLIDLRLLPKLSFIPILAIDKIIFILVILFYSVYLLIDSFIQ